MTAEHKKYLKQQTVIAFFSNGIINLIIAYFLNRNSSIESFDMATNYLNLIIDITITCFISGWLIAWSANDNVKKSGLAASVPPQNKWQSRMAALFKMPVRYAWLLCLVIIPVFYGLTALGILLFGITGFTFWGFVIYKTCYTALMGCFFMGVLLYSGIHKQGG